MTASLSAADPGRDHRPSRRAVLLAGLVLPLAACTREGDPAPPPPPDADPDPDVALRRAAVQREQALVTAYDLVLAAAPDRQALLGPLRAEHVAHLVALGTTLGATLAAPAAAAAGTLPDAERAASAAHAADALVASRRLAPVLASLAASEASHLVLMP